MPTRIQEVAENVYEFQVPIPFKLRDINLYLVKEPDGCLLIDTGTKAQILMHADSETKRFTWAAKPGPLSLHLGMPLATSVSIVRNYIWPLRAIISCSASRQISRFTRIVIPLD
jgi:hypothetical protein